MCTDVGASLRVLSDPDDFSRYSAVVAPNDARALARAQIKMLGMLDEWGKYAEDKGQSPTMPFAPTKEDVDFITARMYEKAEYRRKLGMMSRDIVQKSFSGERYLREHEQMLWIGKCHKLMDSRILGDLSEDPAEISDQLHLAAPVNDEVIPRSAAPSWRSASPSLRGRSPSPARTHDAMRSGSRLSEAMRSTSRLSTASTMNNPHTDFTVLNNMTHGQAQLTALPGYGYELSDLNPSSSSTTPTKRPTTSTSRRSRSRRNSRDYARSVRSTHTNGTSATAIAGGSSSNSNSGVLEFTSAMYKSPFDSPFAPPRDQRKVPKRRELRYRNSDVSVINLETVGRFLSPMS